MMCVVTLGLVNANGYWQFKQQGGFEGFMEHAANQDVSLPTRRPCQS
jgi:hypothetical protein